MSHDNHFSIKLIKYNNGKQKREIGPVALLQEEIAELGRRQEGGIEFETFEEWGASERDLM